MRIAAVLCLVLTACDGCPTKHVPPTLRPPLIVAPDAAPPPLPPPIPMPAGWLKGQLHTHSSESDDSKTRPADVHRWYEQHGFDFVVFTDHNAITDTPDTATTLTIPGVELTRNMPTPHHVNALFVTAQDGHVDLTPLGGRTPREVYSLELQQARALGGIAMLNHPNMGWGASDTALLLELAKKEHLTLLEVQNESWDSNNQGDSQHASTEALWDALLGARLPVFATATDDAHHYFDAPAMIRDGEQPFTGDLGFVAVHAAKDTASIRAAIAKGDFYASNGVLLTSCVRDTDAIHLTSDAEMLFETIGMGGKVLRQERGTRLDAKLAPSDGPYVRVRVTSATGKRAWTQAVFGG